MQVLTDVGQIAVIVDGKSYHLIPSFSAMARLSQNSPTRLTDLVKLGRTLFPYTFKLNWRHII
ncbi:hypothetical protein AB7W63_05695 [Providencia rettgeri]